MFTAVRFSCLKCLKLRVVGIRAVLAFHFLSPILRLTLATTLEKSQQSLVGGTQRTHQLLHQCHMSHSRPRSTATYLSVRCLATIQLIGSGLATTAGMTRSSYHWCSVASRQQLSSETVGTRGLSVRKARTGRVKCVDWPYGLTVVSKACFQSFCEGL